jgi:hypothetical protein
VTRNLNLNDAKTNAINRNYEFGSETFRSQLKPLFLIASIFLLNFTSRIVFAPLLPTIESNLGLSHGTAGSLFFFFPFDAFLNLGVFELGCWNIQGLT